MVSQNGCKKSSEERKSMRKEDQQSLPLWGPYSKKYMGLSRVMRESRVPGARYDLVLHPTYANSAHPAPNVTVPSGFHPWDADADGTYFNYRFELIWKDSLYADAELFRLEEDAWGICVTYVNHTEKAQNCLLNFFSAIEYPQSGAWDVREPRSCDRWDALEYETMEFARPRPWTHLMPDGMRRGEVPCDAFTGGSGLGETWYCKMASHLKLDFFGADAGDRVAYRKSLNHSYRDAVLCVRYRTMANTDDLRFQTPYGVIVFEKTQEPEMAYLSLGAVPAGEFCLELESCGCENNGVMLDFLCVLEREQAKELQVCRTPYPVVPEMKRDENRVTYQYSCGEPAVTLTVYHDRLRERKLDSGCLEDALANRLSNSDPTYDNLTRSFSGSFAERHTQDGFYHIMTAEAVFVPPGGSVELYACVGTETAETFGLEALKTRRQKCREKVRNHGKEEGKAFEQSVRLLKTALLTNVVYPIWRHGEPMIHYTPGKRWDSLYTWDSGFIGLGLAEYSRSLASYIMDFYLSEEDNEDFAFLFHGSMVPTQFYLWHALIQKSSGQEREALAACYPMFRRYYRFFAGKAEGSTTARLGSGLLTVYDYFYNAGGMDDYPAQVAMHRQRLEQSVAPVCSSVNLIRIARFMKQAALAFGHPQDVAGYEEDIRRTGQALQQYSWDEESGYFGYVVHDQEGTPTGIFRDETGGNYNRGVDGVTPLMAGICTAEQTERLLAHLKSERELWSPVGITNVDMSAPYYYDNGYWNGSVWFPYQYFMWKTLLDLGESEFAFAVANRALEAWSSETDFSYNTFEMLQIRTGRGGWFHQFGGLSAPVCVFYQSYYAPGTVTGGFDLWLEKVTMEGVREKAGCQRAEILCRNDSGHESVLLVSMDRAADWTVTVNKEPDRFQEHVGGTLEIRVAPGWNEILVKRG